MSRKKRRKNDDNDVKRRWWEKVFMITALNGIKWGKSWGKNKRWIFWGNGEDNEMTWIDWMDWYKWVILKVFIANNEGEDKGKRYDDDDEDEKWEWKE